MNYSSRPPQRRPRAAAPCPMPQAASGLLAISSIPMQTFGETYPPEAALCKGTIFPELDLPYCGGGPCC